jgi:hypothetical protein
MTSKNNNNITPKNQAIRKGELSFATQVLHNFTNMLNPAIPVSSDKNTQNTQQNTSQISSNNSLQNNVSDVQNKKS